MPKRLYWVGGGIVPVCILALLLIGQRTMAATYAGQAGIMNYVPPASLAGAGDSHIDDHVDGTNQHFFMKVPAQYTDSTPYGLVIYLGADDHPQQIPPEWDAVIEQRKLIFVAPQGAGDDVAVPRRLGMAVITARAAEHFWKIDPRRVFVAGFGEGARVAGMLGFFAPDVFVGSVQMSGADFYSPVAHATGGAADAKPYGGLLSDATAAEIQAAKPFRFAFITGKDDPHFGQIADIVQDGYVKGGFQCTLIDAPGIGQGVCAPRRLNQAMDFLEGIKSPEPATEPAPPAWMAKDPSHWPQILLSNRVTHPGGDVIYLGSSSLARMPNGAVVLCTARHLLSGAKLSDFSAIYKSWVAFGASPNDAVRITRVAMDLDQPESFDALVLCSASQSKQWPATVLPMRRTPLEIGDTVYLVAVPFDQARDHQNVYKGTVMSSLDNKQWQYTVDGNFETTGCSGAPVLDEYGQLAAVNLGHMLQQTAPGKRQLTCMAACDVLSAIKLPPDVHPIAAVAADSSSARGADAAPDTINERANAALRRAQLFVDNHINDKARAELQTVIDAYPGTDAAKKARELLAQLPSL